jgi:hypothetical protein
VTNASLRCRALLFDLDGVLADSTASVEHHWRAWAERHGLDPDALLQVVHGRRAIDTIRDVAPTLDAEAELAALVAAEAGDTAGVTASPGAAALLPRLPAGAWAVVTSGVRAVALARLQAGGLPLPPLLVPADEITRGSPIRRATSRPPRGWAWRGRLRGVRGCPAGVAARVRRACAAWRSPPRTPPRADTRRPIAPSLARCRCSSSRPAMERDLHGGRADPRPTVRQRP